jgi:hypothetical protein
MTKDPRRGATASRDRRCRNPGATRSGDTGAGDPGVGRRARDELSSTPGSVAVTMHKCRKRAADAYQAITEES